MRIYVYFAIIQVFKDRPPAFGKTGCPPLLKDKCFKLNFSLAMSTFYKENHYAAKKNPKVGPFALFEKKLENNNYDYIILGAGSAGCIVAADLAKEFPDRSVLLVEGGPSIPESDTTVWDPTQWVLVSDNPALEWGYQSTPQAGLNDRIIPMGRSRGLGGCSVHNAMVYVRGGYKGFDAWADQGNYGWDYKSILPYFEAVESQLSVTIAESDHFIDALVQACGNLGIPYNSNYNQDSDLKCIAPFQFAISPEGKRETSYSAFLTDVPDNLTIATDWRIEKIIIDSSKTASGVIISPMSGGSSYEMMATSEVILSAGAIGSPQILMLSGVGPASVLSEVGIDVIHEAEGVGQNLQDDLYVTAWYKSKNEMPPQPYGLMGSVIFSNSSDHDPAQGTDIECSLAAGTMAGLNIPVDQQKSWLIYPNIQLLKSRGTVTLASNNPEDAPIIDPNYLSVESDMANCIDALEQAMEIGADPALADWVEETLLPNTTDLEEYIRSTAGTCYHYAGTCKMGPDSDSMAVVAPDLTVYGISNLRVIDSSIIPTTVSGNTAAATMMIAKKGSAMIIESAKKS